MHKCTHACKGQRSMLNVLYTIFFFEIGSPTGLELLIQLD